MDEIEINPPFFSREDAIKPIIEILKKHSKSLQFEERSHALGGVYVDVLLKIYEIPFAFIKYVNYEDSEYAFEETISKTFHILQNSRIPSGIVIDNLKNYFLCESHDYKERSVNINEIYQHIVTLASTYNEVPDIAKARTALIERFESEKVFVKNVAEVTDIFQRACEHLQYSAGEIYMLPKDEADFIKSLLGKINETRICRYTSLDSLLKMIENQNISMCGFASMNDPNEIHYLDYYFPWQSSINRNIDSIKEDNKLFVLSCMSGSSDDLTMWRLYGDDSCGVSLEFEIDYSKINDTSFFISPVNYISVWYTQFSILKLLKELQEMPIGAGWYFTFKNWNVWKAFFKAIDYQIEKEVRLLYFSDDATQEFHTFIDNNNGIINQCVQFPLNNDTRGKNLFPLTLKKIILGPNMPNVRKNYEQIQLLLSINNFKDVEVEISRLTNYRK